MNSTNDLAAPRLPRRRSLAHLFGQWGVFFRGFVEHPRMVGSIIPSSRFTIRKMLAPVKWDECRLFVEYGPGVGTFCGPVLERLRREVAELRMDNEFLGKAAAFFASKQNPRSGSR